MATKKVICECKGDFVAYGLFGAGKSKHGDFVWVHSCGFPFPLYYESFIERCPDCFGSFSSPFEEVCQRCFRISNPEGQYRGWYWARQINETQRTATKKPS